jgi:hypothetical protein
MEDRASLVWLEVRVYFSAIARLFQPKIAISSWVVAPFSAAIVVPAFRNP